MAYQPIENYGIIGNMRTAALVGMNGSIDWFCVPSFDSPSVFAAILDDQKGGRFEIAPQEEGIRAKQFYWPETNVLVTRFAGRRRRARRFHAGRLASRIALAGSIDSARQSHAGSADFSHEMPSSLRLCACAASRIDRSTWRHL
jgi:GH15 family glucan-1,4-alpha-glucosidase